MPFWDVPWKKALLLGGGALLLGLQVVDGVRYFLVPHVVKSYAEYSAFLGGAELHRSHRVMALKFDCDAIRESTIAALEQDLTAAVREAFPNESPETIDDYMVNVAGDGRNLLLVSAAGLDAKKLADMLTGQMKAPPENILVLRSLWSRISAGNGLTQFEQIDVLPFPSPCVEPNRGTRHSDSMPEE